MNIRHFKFNARYGLGRWVTDHGGGWFTVEGKSSYYRASSNSKTGDIEMIDLEGGPAIFVGSTCAFLPEDIGKVEEIIIEQNKCDNNYVVVRIRCDNP